MEENEQSLKPKSKMLVGGNVNKEDFHRVSFFYMKIKRVLGIETPPQPTDELGLLNC